MSYTISKGQVKTPDDYAFVMDIAEKDLLALAVTPAITQEQFEAYTKAKEAKHHKAVKR